MRTAFMEMFGLSAPIVQAPVGSAASVELAVQVAQSGGLGSYPCTWKEFSDIKQAIRHFRERGASYFLNFVMHYSRNDMVEILDLAPKAVSFSWGLDPHLIAAAKSRGILVGAQVGHPASVATAADFGVDFIVAQSNEAGGHVQSSMPLDRLLPEIVSLAGPLPVLAAGGIACSEQVAACIKKGASGVMMGTRFVAATESLAHQTYKQALCDARAADTVFTNCFDGGWSYAMQRVLRNVTLQNWEAAGCPPSPRRPGEHEVVLQRSNGEVTLRYEAVSPLVTDSGSLLEACLYAGTGVEHITSIEPAGEIVKRLWKEAQHFL